MQYKVLNFPDAMRLASILHRYWESDGSDSSIYATVAEVTEEELLESADILQTELSLDEIVSALEVNQIGELIRYYKEVRL